MTKQAHKCGWCITGHHDSCKPTVGWYDRTWNCECTHEKPTSGTDKTISSDRLVVNHPTNKETK